MKPEFKLLDRREFVGFVSKTAALLGLASLPSDARGDDAKSANYFAYDVSRLEKTDPRMIRYTEIAKWRAPHREARRLAVGPDTRLYICAGDYISIFTARGEPGGEIALGAAACCVGVAQDGTIYAGLRDHLEVFDAQGARRATWAAPDRKSWLTSIAVGKNDIFAADAGQRVILRYDKSGRIIGRIGEKNAERNAPGFVVPSPYLEVLIHPDGLLRVNNIGRHEVETYTFEGDFEGAWGRPSARIDGFCGCCNPIGLALLPDGRFVTCEKGLPRVKIYTATGEFESVVAGSETFPENARACSGLNDCAHGGLHAAVDSTGQVCILDIVTGDVRVMRRKV